MDIWVTLLLDIINEADLTNMEKDEKYSTTEELGESYFNGAISFRTKICWPNAIGFLVIHLAGFFGMWLCVNQLFRLQLLSPLFMYYYGYCGGEAITIGAHRLWSHRSFKARRQLRVILMLCQTIAGQNSIYTWVRDHRLHHKCTDTDADPHNATRGFFFSHIGWLMMMKHPELKKKGKGIDLSDLERDPVVMFQKRHFKKLFYTIGVVIPTVVPCLLWNETPWNSFFICVCSRYVCLLHITWLINSAAHLYGTKPYDKNIMPSENTFASYMTNGEGWHNYHHAFPWDYKAAEYGVRYNFTKDIIEFCQRIGWAYDLRVANSGMVANRILKRGDGSHGSHLRLSVR